MRKESRKIRNRRLAVLLTCTVAIGAGVAVAAPALYGAARTWTAAPAAARGGSDEFRGVLNVYCTPRGFEEEEIELPPGRYVLAIRNGSGLEDLAFSVHGREESPLATGTARAGSTVEATMILEEGNYTITEASHSNWMCEVTVAQ